MGVSGKCPRSFSRAVGGTAPPAHPDQVPPQPSAEQRQWPQGCASAPSDHTEIHARRHESRDANPLEKHPSRAPAREHARAPPKGDAHRPWRSLAAERRAVQSSRRSAATNNCHRMPAHKAKTKRATKRFRNPPTLSSMRGGSDDQRIRESEDQRIRGSEDQRIRGSPDQDIKPFFCPRQSSTATHQSNKSGKNTRGSERSSAMPKAHSTPRGAPRLQQRSSTVRALRTPQRLPAPSELQAQPLIQTQRSSPPSLFKPFFCRGTERTSK